ncbi:BCCT family transporter [Neisseria brasiliensis]|uniref:BCCT family transporter n=1 Tax=Neisseria sp. N95_16 TaxID=2024408 RepID=UPI0018E26878|nr:BCCT family transporter [Neisseria brasiliensis]
MSKQLTVLNISAVLIVAITAIGLMFPAAFGHYADVIYQYIAAHFGWLYMLSVFVFDVFNRADFHALRQIEAGAFR